MKLRIITDSASDFTLEELKERQVELIPMPLLCGDQTYLDDKTTPVEAFWKMMTAGVAIKTSQPATEAILKVFEDAKQAGDAVICITLSSKLSGTYQGAMVARSMVEYEPVYVVDGRGAAAAAAEKLLVLRACQLRDEARLSPCQIAAQLEEFRSRIRLLACLDTLEYLARGGRLPKAAANVGTVLRLKPIVTFSQRGEIQVVKKALGSHRAMGEMQKLVEACPVDPAFPIIPLYAMEDGNCRDFVNGLAGGGFPHPLGQPEPIGATIGAYIGPGGYGLAFVEKEGSGR